MDGIRGEVSNKIRSAIKAKLMELGAYVDDELPDYIMVMVANKRSRQQMDDDLLLFLGDSTLTFTAWLHTVLSKLQQVTVNSVELKKGSEKKRSYEDPKKEKKKKMKKEKSPDKNKAKEKTAEERRELSASISQAQSKPIKAEPIDLLEDEDSLLNESQPSLSHTESLGANPILQPAGRKVSEHKAFEEEEDDDDFINLKADAEADMWGEAEENSSTAVKSSVVPEPASVGVSLKPSQSKLPVTEDQSKELVPASVKTTPNITTVKPTIAPTPAASSSKSAPEAKPAPRIIKISETIRQEQESLKQSAKPPREPQKMEKKCPPSPIIFSTISVNELDEELDIFSRKIAQELKQLPQRLRDLAKSKIQQVIIRLQASSPKIERKASHQSSQDSLSTADSGCKKSSKSLLPKDRSRNRRRHRKKSRELTVEERDNKIGKIDNSNGQGVKPSASRHRKRRSLFRPGPLRMDCVSSNYFSHSNGPPRSLPQSVLSVPAQSPSPPRTLNSVVGTVKSQISKNLRQIK